MKNLSTLKPVVRRGKKRLGRGSSSGKGAKSTRGTKRHQTAREKISLWFEGGQNRMVKKFPLLRGKSKNKSYKKKPNILNLSEFEKVPDQTVIDLAYIKKNKMIDEKDLASSGVKILSKGDITKKLIFKLPVSKRAGEKIEKAGGRCE